jgi:type II secretory pathway pseudopilin PulG
MARLRRRRCLLRDEAGTTILEVTIVIALLSGALVAALTSLSSFQAASAGGDVRLENLTEARSIIAVLTKDIRTAARPSPTASPFVSATPRSLQFYANLATTTGPKLVSLIVDANGVLREEVVNPAGTAPDFTYAAAPQTRLVGSYIANTAAQPLLRYYDAAGAELTGDPLSAANRLQIDSIRLELAVRKSTNLSVAPTTVRTTVRLPNVAYNPLQGA